MPSISTGTCNVTPGSQNVTFVGSSVSEMSAGDLFRIISDDAFYTIASVDSSNAKVALTGRYRNSTYEIEVVNEVVAIGDGTNVYGFTLDYTPVIPGTVEISDEDDYETFTDNGDGTLTGDAGGSGSISYDDGTCTLTFNSDCSTGKNILADTYYYGLYLTSMPYQVLADFTDHYSWPEPYAGNENNELIIRQAIRNIDSQLYINTKESYAIHLFDSTSSVSIVNGIEAFTIPAYMNNFKLADVIGSVHTKGVTGSTDIQVRRRRSGSDQDLLSAKVTIGDEYYANDGTVDSTYMVVQTGDQIYVDVDSVHSGTAPLGLDVTLVFQKN